MRPAGLRIIGLTGGIACGKSSVARMLEQEGFPVIDADQLSREAVLPGTPGLARLVDVFGAEICAADGTLDRKKLATIVFSDPERRRQLEQLLHPEIRRLADQSLAAAAAAGSRVVFYMAPLLIEAGAVERVDEIWVVTVSPDVQLRRLMARDSISSDEAGRIIASQMPLAEKERYGAAVINNSGTVAQTREQVRRIIARERGVNR